MLTEYPRPYKFFQLNVSVGSHAFWEHSVLRIALIVATPVFALLPSFEAFKDAGKLTLAGYAAAALSAVLAMTTGYLTLRATQAGTASRLSELVFMELLRTTTKKPLTALDTVERATFQKRLLRVTVEQLFKESRHHQATLLFPTVGDPNTLFPAIRYPDPHGVESSKTRIPLDTGPGGIAWRCPGFLVVVQRIPKFKFLSVLLRLCRFLRLRRHGGDRLSLRREFFRKKLHISHEIFATFSENTRLNITAIGCLAIREPNMPDVALMALAFDTTRWRGLWRIKDKRVRWALTQVGTLLAYTTTWKEP